MPRVSNPLGEHHAGATPCEAGCNPETPFSKTPGRGMVSRGGAGCGWVGERILKPHPALSGAGCRQVGLPPALVGAGCGWLEPHLAWWVGPPRVDVLGKPSRRVRLRGRGLRGMALPRLPFASVPGHWWNHPVKIICGLGWACQGGGDTGDTWSVLGGGQGGPPPLGGSPPVHPTLEPVPVPPFCPPPHPNRPET